MESENITSTNATSWPKFTLFNDNIAPLMTSLSLLCFLVNVTIISLFFIDPLHSLRRPSGYLVASLNAGAMFTSISSIIMTLPGLNTTAFLSVNVFFAIFAVAATASFNFIFILSYERYLLVTAPIKYKTVATVGRVRILAVLVWLCSAIIGVFSYKSFHIHGFLWLHLPFGFAFIILVVIDIKTFIEIKKMDSNIGSITETGSQKASLNQAIKNRIDMHTKFARVVVLLLLNFIFFACPLFAFHIMNTINKGCDGCLFTSMVDDGTIYAITILLFIFNDINTALFYLILIPKYRMSFVAIFKKSNTTPNVSS